VGALILGASLYFIPISKELARTPLSVKRIDNRASCAILIDLAKRMKSKKIDYQLFLVAAVQEEVGSRGAKVAAQTLSPDMRS